MKSDLHENGKWLENRDGALPIERAVIDRYAQAAAEPQAGLCCPAAQYDPALLELLPAEIIAKDYGCGNPARYVETGESVIDLGSGSGKGCYLLAQRVGPEGSVIGVDFNDAMLSLSRRYQADMAARLGYDNVRFLKARIQDLALDLEKADQLLRAKPLCTIEQLAEFEAACERLRRQEPAIPDGIADVVVSSCVLNLVKNEDKMRLFQEIHRVLRPGGRAVISDIVCDEDPTDEMINDPNLWTGCVSGAFREDRLLEYFETVGLYGIEILSRSEQPWQTINGIEFRSMTVRAFKGKEGPCLERNQAVIYMGPWKSVRDDDGHLLHRGQRMAVCDKTFRLLTRPDGPYANFIIAVPPRMETPLPEAVAFDCRRVAFRDPRETKGVDYRASQRASACSENGRCC